MFYYSLLLLRIIVIFLLIPALLGAMRSEVKTLTGREGQSVTLNTGCPVLQSNAQILWSFGPAVIVNSQVLKEKIIRGHLQLDRETACLTIRNLTTNNSGVYQLQIISGQHISSQHFNLTVFRKCKVFCFQKSNNLFLHGLDFIRRSAIQFTQMLHIVILFIFLSAAFLVCFQ